MTRRVSINVITNNDVEYLPDFFRALSLQTFHNFDLLVIDNNSQDDTVHYIRRNHPRVAILQNLNNLGISKAHNQGIKFSKSEYILFLSQAILLLPDTLQIMVSAIEKDDSIGAVGGKVLRMTDGSEEGSKLQSDMIESAGLSISKGRRIYRRGNGESDRGQFDESGYVFGFDGDFVMYRRNALESTKIEIPKETISEYLDEDLSLAGGDIDLAWRMYLSGWKALYLPNVSVYNNAVSSSAKIKSKFFRKRRNDQNTIYSVGLRNHLLMIAKNEPISTMFQSFLPILGLKFQQVAVGMIFQRGVVREMRNFMRLLPKSRLKRNSVQSKIKVSKEDIHAITSS
ncbi:MAG TPA: glycosyltransferase family 2 protein [Patescibacteria group bacterium]|nr:glycosyltransferase family 2 protein [Patescibacteria group bacterium]